MLASSMYPLSFSSNLFYLLTSGRGTKEIPLYQVRLFLHLVHYCLLSSEMCFLVFRLESSPPLVCYLIGDVRDLRSSACKTFGSTSELWSFIKGGEGCWHLSNECWMSIFIIGCNVVPRGAVMCSSLGCQERRISSSEPSEAACRHWNWS